MGFARQGVPPVLLADAVRVEHELGTHPARGEGDGGGAARAEFVAEGEGHAQHGGLGEVVEEVHPVGVTVVVGGAVGDLDDQAAGPAEQQRQGVVAGDGVRLDREAEQPEAVVEVVLPHGGVPLEEPLAAPDVIDEDVQVTLFVRDAVHQACLLYTSGGRGCCGR